MFYSNLIYFILALFLVYKLIKRDLTIFEAYVFLIPFHSWFYNIGLNLSMSQIVNVMMIMLIPALIKRNNTILKFGSKYVVLFLIFAFLNTIIISTFFMEDILKIGGFFRSEGRFIAQLAFIALSFSIVPLAFLYIKNFDTIFKVLKTYLNALKILTILGIIQFLTFYLLGFDLFPLNIDEFGDIRSGMYAYEQTKYFRMSSLGGEPKGFAMSLILGFFIIQVFNRYDIFFSKYDMYVKYVFLFTALATVSTSGFVLFLLLSLIYLVIKKPNRKQYNIFAKKNIFKLVLLISIAAIILNYTNIFTEIMEERILERKILSEDFDEPIQKFLSKYPEYLMFGSGLGNIHNLAHPFIPLENLHYMENSIFVAKSGYLRIISELGLVGFSLFVLMFSHVYKRLNYFKNKLTLIYKNYVAALRMSMLIIFVAYLARIYLNMEFILVFSICNVAVFSNKMKYIFNKEYEFQNETNLS